MRRHIYVGNREAGHGTGILVTVREEGVPGSLAPLPVRLDVRKHSPTGFEWGYEGSGPAQLALALCLHVLETEGAPWWRERALHCYQDVKRLLIAPVQDNQWQFTSDDVRWAIRDAEQERPLEMVQCDRHARTHPSRALCPECLREEQEEEERLS